MQILNCNFFYLYLCIKCFSLKFLYSSWVLFRICTYLTSRRKEACFLFSLSFSIFQILCLAKEFTFVARVKLFIHCLLMSHFISRWFLYKFNFYKTIFIEYSNLYITRLCNRAVSAILLVGFKMHSLYLERGLKPYFKGETYKVNAYSISNKLK